MMPHCSEGPLLPSLFRCMYFNLLLSWRSWLNSEKVAAIGICLNNSAAFLWIFGGKFKSWPVKLLLLFVLVHKRGGENLFSVNTPFYKRHCRKNYIYIPSQFKEQMILTDLFCIVFLFLCLSLRTTRPGKKNCLHVISGALLKPK